MTILVFAPDSSLIDKRISEHYLRGEFIKNIAQDPEIGISMGSVLKRIGRLRKRGLLPYRSEPKTVKVEAPVFLCPRCGSASDSKVEAELCCAAEEEISDVLRRCGL
jgi:hypothetical protein